MAEDSRLKVSSLIEQHRSLGAKLGAFGGWSMPLEYKGGGVLREHEAVRTAVGLFDVSHLGKGSVRGPGAKDHVNATLTNDLDRVSPGQAQYTLCCTDAGGVVDDLLAYLRADDDVFLVPNAANTAEVLRRLRESAPAGVTVTDRHDELAVLAVQGPRSGAVLGGLGLPHEHGYMSFVDTHWQGRPVTVCRSGYTGEIGFELLPPMTDAPALWAALLDAVRAEGGLPCGLGARDTLRTEMGYPLHGQDLSVDITPVQARLTWAVGWKKPAFRGRAALVREREEGPRRVLTGLRAVDRAIPRPHTPVLYPDGRAAGEVTSGTFSPTLRVGIGLGYVDASINDGAQLELDLRGRRALVEAVRPPFVTSSPR